MMKKSLDVLLVEKGLAPSRQKAQAMIMAGEVSVNGQIQSKCGYKYTTDSDIGLKVPALIYVGRGGLKLEQALRDFDLDVREMIAADIGASTGGFTDCLLQHGASKVYAIDVGYGQLDLKLRQDERVINMERTNVRHLEKLPELVDLAVIDVSFISLRLVLPCVRNYLKADARIVTLFKPQFEVGREVAARYRGVIRDEKIQRQALDDFKEWLSESGFSYSQEILSPIKGAKGNLEYLVLISI